MNAKKVLILIIVLFIVISGIIYSGMRDSVVNSNSVEEFAFGSIKVDVSGAVEEPGVYTLNFDSRCEDAIKVAGGLTPYADESFVNKAEFLRDGQKLYIPSKTDSLDDIYLKTGEKPSFDEGLEYVVNINEDGVYSLTILPGIGVKTAENIVAHREEHGRFDSKEELLDVPGIGEGTLEKIWDYITVD